MILLKNGLVIDPASKRGEKLDILINGEVIERIAKEINVEGDVEVHDCEGYMIAPGLIDVHVHFRDPGLTYKEDIITGANASAKGGFTTVVCMANTKPIVDNVETLEYILDKAKEAKIEVLQAGAITKGFGGKELVDMEELLNKGAVGFTDDGIALKDADLVYKAMVKAKELNVPLSFHEEDPSLIKENGINLGYVAEKLNITGSPNMAEEVLVARDAVLALETGAKVNIQHISSGLSVDIVRWAKEMGANITAEVTPHHFTLTQDAVLEFGANAKMNPPLRTEEDRIKIIEGLREGIIEIIATDHAPHSEEEKSSTEIHLAPSGIIGLETALALGITNLVKRGHLSYMELIEKMTINPAKLYNLDRGRLFEGGKADLVVFNPDEEWIVDEFESKSSNTPFKGMKLYGKVKKTIYRGGIVYEG